MRAPRYEYRYRKPQRRRINLVWVLVVVIIAALFSYPFLQPRMLSVAEHTYAVQGLASNLRNLRIVFASDFHQGGWFDAQQLSDTIQAINDLDADLVILGGDYAEDSAQTLAFFEALPVIRSRLGVYAVCGEHDRPQDDSGMRLLISEMKAAGVTPLFNDIARVKVGQSYFYIAGADEHGYADVAGLARQVKADDFVIFAGHTPDMLPDLLSARSADNDSHWYDLALFGHTHGGQISFLGHTPFASLRPQVSARYLSGWREENRAAILVSNGVGTTFVPARLFAPPQIHVITLKAR